MSNFKITKNNAKQLKEEFQFHTENALIQIGMTGEGFAKIKITEEGAIDTGRLRNSITWAIAGKNPNISSYSANKAGETGGSYQGTAPTSKEPAVFVGTNVKYAPGIETGSHRKKGAVHFLQDAANNHKSKYEEIIREEFKNL